MINVKMDGLIVDSSSTVDGVDEGARLKGFDSLEANDFLVTGTLETGGSLDAVSEVAEAVEGGGGGRGGRGNYDGKPTKNPKRRQKNNQTTIYNESVNKTTTLTKKESKIEAENEVLRI